MHVVLVHPSSTLQFNFCQIRYVLQQYIVRSGHKSSTSYVYTMGIKLFFFIRNERYNEVKC